MGSPAELVFGSKMEKYSKLAGKWTKINHSGYEEFSKANPEAAQGMDVEDVKVQYECKPEKLICNFSVGGAPPMTVNYDYDGSADNDCGGYKFKAELSLEEAGPMPGRMPGGTIVMKFTGDAGELKEERVQFHGPNRMIVETISNDSCMITTFEREGTQM